MSNKLTFSYLHSRSSNVVYMQSVEFHRIQKFYLQMIYLQIKSSRLQWHQRESGDICAIYRKATDSAV